MARADGDNPSIFGGATRIGARDINWENGNGRQHSAVSVAIQVCADPAGEKVVLISTQDGLNACIWATASA